VDELHEGPFPEYLLPGVRLAKATREACPVCGHPTGDCAGELPPPHRIVGDNIDTKPQPDPSVLVPEDHYEERQITPFTRVKVLVAAAGSYVTPERARELGLL
jgi:hypothetical protein